MKTNIFLVCLLFLPFYIWSEPLWMKNQIDSDLKYFQDKTISLNALENFYKKKGSAFQLVKYTIIDNLVKVDSKFVHKNHKERVDRYSSTLQYLCETKGLPNTTLLISVNDGLNSKNDFPVFGMCKKNSDRIILIPDYEALGNRFQVLRHDGIDITQANFPWKAKIPKLMWRGSTAQIYTKISDSNLNLFSRVRLCELSKKFSNLIDAKFTLFVQGGENVPYLKQFTGNHISFFDQMNYKYHIWIDGNVAPYSKSGWKLFTNALIFKPESPWVQWYFSCLKDDQHYVSVNSDLSNLKEKLDWAAENDSKAQKIAANCRKYAVENFTLKTHLQYLYEVIMAYQQIHFVP